MWKAGGVCLPKKNKQINMKQPLTILKVVICKFENNTNKQINLNPNYCFIVIKWKQFDLI